MNSGKPSNLSAENGSPSILAALCEAAALTMMEPFEGINAATRWTALGADSLDVVETEHHFWELTGIEILLQDLLQPTVGETAAAIEGAIATAASVAAARAAP